MDYTITDATLNDVTDIVDVTLQNALRNRMQDRCVGPIDGSEGFYIKLGAKQYEHGWLVWDNILDLLSTTKE